MRAHHATIALKQRFSVRVIDTQTAPKQWIPVREINIQTTSKQGLPTLHEKAMAPVSVHVADTTSRQGPTAAYVKAMVSAGPVNTPVCHFVSDNAQGAVRQSSPSCRQVLSLR